MKRTKGPSCASLTRCRLLFFFFFLAPFCVRRSQGRDGRVHGSPSGARGRDLGPAGQTAWCRDLALAPAGVSQELVQGWGGASSTGLRRDGELEEGSRKRALRSDGNDATPPEDPSSLGKGPQRGGGAGRPRTSKEAHEGGSFRVPAPPDFKPENDEPTPPTAVKFGISLPALAARSVAQGTARVGGSPGLRQPLARHRADEGRIDRELRAMPEVEAVAHDFDAPCVVDRHIEVHGRQGGARHARRPPGKPGLQRAQGAVRGMQGRQSWSRRRGDLHTRQGSPGRSRRADRGEGAGGVVARAGRGSAGQARLRRPTWAKL